MIHYNVYNDKGKYWTILCATGNYCGCLDLLIPIAHRAIGFKTSVHTLLIYRQRWVGMGKIFQLVILQALYSLGRANIDRRLRVQDVECVLTVSANCRYGTID